MTTGRLTRAQRVIGGVALAAGIHDLVRGTERIIGDRPVPSASLDSELRFGSAWYATAGLLMLRAEPQTARILDVGWLLAALGRTLSIKTHGRPHPFYLLLTAAEVAIPVARLYWQHAAARSCVDHLEPAK
jgi:hypothetical protein